CQLAEKRRCQRRGQHVNGEDPTVQLEPAEPGDDGRHRRADDGSVDGKQENYQHDTRDGQVSSRMRGVRRLQKIHVGLIWDQCLSANAFGLRSLSLHLNYFRVGVKEWKILGSMGFQLKAIRQGIVFLLEGLCGSSIGALGPAQGDSKYLNL